MTKLTGVFLIVILLSSVAHANECGKHFTVNELEFIKKEKFTIESDAKRNEIAVNLLSCLGAKDPKIRDGVVYEAISFWLRENLLETATVENLFNSLVDILNKPNLDKANFTQPFAALVLSEVVRYDRVTPFLSDKERQGVVDISTRYMNEIVDYRGFNETEGWRHSVAHTSDVFLQLAVNKNIAKSQLDQMLKAIADQVIPKNDHFYTFGEPNRLAMAFVYIVIRGEHTETELSKLFKEIADPAPFKSWGDVYTSTQGLARLHNTRSFVYSIFAISSQSENPSLKAIQPMLIELIRQLG